MNSIWSAIPLRGGGDGFLGGNKTEARNHIAVTLLAFAANEAKPPNVIMIFCYCSGHVVESSSTLEKKKRGKTVMALKPFPTLFIASPWLSTTVTTTTTTLRRWCNEHFSGHSFEKGTIFLHSSTNGNSSSTAPRLDWMEQKLSLIFFLSHCWHFIPSSQALRNIFVVKHLNEWIMILLHPRTQNCRRRLSARQGPQLFPSCESSRRGSVFVPSSGGSAPVPCLKSTG